MPNPLVGMLHRGKVNTSNQKNISAQFREFKSSFDTIVRIRHSCASIDNTASLSFNIVGNNALVYQANVTVTKLA